MRAAVAVAINLHGGQQLGPSAAGQLEMNRSPLSKTGARRLVVVVDVVDVVVVVVVVLTMV